MSGALATESDGIEPLDYDALYAGYLASLVDNLRGFRAAAPGLELWVPDEDPLASLSNLLDAAMVVGRRRLSVRLSAETLRRLGPDLPRLLPMAQAFGDAHLAADGDGVLLDVSGLDAPAPRRAGARPEPRIVDNADRDGDRAAGPREIDRQASISEGARAAPGADAEAVAFELYRPALERAASAPSHRGRSLATDPGWVIVRGCCDGVELSLAVATGTHQILSASHDARPPLELGLLERLCDVISGLPLLEAAEHGTIRLERVLRGAGPRPVSGIVLPEAVHPSFRFVRALLAQALSDYRRQTGFAGVHSRHDDRPGERWQHASDAERRDWLQEALGAALAAFGVDPRSARVETIRHDVRVELSLELPPGAEAPVIVMGLERALQAGVDPRLEVYVTERRDRNTKRRLAVLGGEA